MPVVECVTIDGSKRSVPKENLVLRLGVYAIIVDNGRVLLVKMRHSEKYHLPGGGVHVGERMLDALRREVGEETGIEVEVERFAHFEELFFYYDPSGTAYHGLHFYYVCRPKTISLVDDSHVKDDAVEQPRWVDVQNLKAQDFQAHGAIILGICQEIGAACQ